MKMRSGAPVGAVSRRLRSVERSREDPERQATFDRKSSMMSFGHIEFPCLLLIANT